MFREVSIKRTLCVVALTVVTLAGVSAGTTVVISSQADVADTYYKIGYSEDVELGGQEWMGNAERIHSYASWSAIKFNLDSYIGGDAVSDAEIKLWYNGTYTEKSPFTLDIALLPMKTAWSEHYSNTLTCDGTNPWPGDNGKITGLDPVTGEPANFSSTPLGIVTLIADTEANTNAQTYQTFNSQELVDFVNGVISGTETYEGFLLYCNITEWGQETHYVWGASENADYSLRPSMTLTFVPEPATLGLLVSGLLAGILRRRK